MIFIYISFCLFVYRDSDTHDNLRTESRKKYVLYGSANVLVFSTWRADWILGFLALEIQVLKCKNYVFFNSFVEILHLFIIKT